MFVDTRVEGWWLRCAILAAGGEIGYVSTFSISALSFAFSSSSVCPLPLIS